MPSSVYLLRPISSAASEWTEEHLPPDAMSFAGGVAIEWRYLNDILFGMESDGLAQGVDFEVISQTP